MLSKIKCRLISCVLTLALAFTLLAPAYAANDTNPTKDKPSKEVKQITETFKHWSEEKISKEEGKLLSKYAEISEQEMELGKILQQILDVSPYSEDDYGVKTYENSCFDEITSYLPKQSTIGSVCNALGATYIDYFIKDTRITLEYPEAGVVGKTVSSKYKDNTPILLNINNADFSSYAVGSDGIVTTTRNKTDAELEEESAAISSDSLFAAAATTTIDPKSLSAYPTLVAKSAVKKLTINYNFPALGSLGYASTQPVKVYETFRDYSRSNIAYEAFSAGTTVVLIANVMRVATGTVIGWFGAVGIILSAGSKITGAANIKDEESYQMQAGKEGTVYDPTSCNKDVEVYSEWDGGKLTMTWQYDGSQFYNPIWGFSARPDVLSITDSDFANTTANTYNDNIYVYGIWKWGVGNGLGY